MEITTIRTLVQVMVDGEPKQPGDVAVVTKADARYLVGRGMAEYHTEEAAQGGPSGGSTAGDDAEAANTGQVEDEGNQAGDNGAAPSDVEPMDEPDAPVDETESAEEETEEEEGEPEQVEDETPATEPAKRKRGRPRKGAK